MRPPARFALTALGAALAVSAAAGAETVRLPVELDLPFLQRLLVEEVYTDGDAVAQLGAPGACSSLRLTEPRLAVEEGSLVLRTRVAGRVGLEAGGDCLLSLPAGGILVAHEEPEVEAGGSGVRFRVTETRLQDASGIARLLPDALWRRADAAVRPRLGGFRLEFDSAFGELRALLPLFVAGYEADVLAALVDSLALEEAGVAEAGVRVVLRFESPPPRAAPGAPAAPLSAEELARLGGALARWDAFLTFVVKVAARETAAEEVRRALLEVLLDARHDLVHALTNPAPGAPDPVPALFVEVWDRLAPVLREVRDDLPAAGALRYLAFATGADALRALVALGPAVGVEISAEGLRRLARTLAPEAPDDPVIPVPGVDPELRAIFGFDPRLVPRPLPAPPAEPEAPEGVTPESGKGAPGTESPDAAGGPGAWRRPPREPSARAGVRGVATGRGPGPRSVPASWVPRAASGPAESGPARLDGWVPARPELREYLALVGTLLAGTGDAVLEGESLEPAARRIYGWLVKATAWQESCWRQFVRADGRVVAIRSPAGAVGIMQVNERVWRGFYEPAGLRDDIAYNARAGAEILLHYLRDYALARAREGDGPDAWARGAYAAYHGGPRHLRRWRDGGAGAALGAIDRAFFAKYQAVKAGREERVAGCFGMAL